MNFVRSKFAAAVTLLIRTQEITRGDLLVFMTISDADALATTLNDSHHWLRSVAKLRSGEPAAVDDIMQEVALAAAKNFTSLRDRSALPAWLYQLTVSASLQHRRRCGRQRKLVDRFAQHASPNEAYDEPPENWLLAVERNQFVRAALQRLRPKDAEILMLKYGHDWTYQELATRLNQTPAAIDGRLQRARKRLRAELSRMSSEHS